MKAGRIRRIRKRIGSLNVYTVRESASLFGDFFGFNRLGLTMSDTRVVAGSHIRAIQIYMRNYRRIWKRKNDHEKESYCETTEKWGSLMVKEEGGFIRFY